MPWREKRGTDRPFKHTCNFLHVLCTYPWKRRGSPAEKTMPGNSRLAGCSHISGGGTARLRESRGGNRQTPLLSELLRSSTFFVHLLSQPLSALPPQMLCSAPCFQVCKPLRARLTVGGTRYSFNPGQSSDTPIRQRHGALIWRLRRLADEKDSTFPLFRRSRIYPMAKIRCG